MMERRLMSDSLDHADVERIFQFRRETVHFQHVVTRMTEVCNKLAALDLPCVSEGAKPYFRDVLDNLMRIEAMSIGLRSEEHTSELQSLMRISYAVFCLKKKNNKQH